MTSTVLHLDVAGGLAALPDHVAGFWLCSVYQFPGGRHPYSVAGVVEEGEGRLLGCSLLAGHPFSFLSMPAGTKTIVINFIVSIMERGANMASRTRTKGFKVLDIHLD